VKWRVKKSTLAGSVAVPPSKSHSIRAVLFASMAKGRSTIDNLLPSPDVDCAIEAMRSAGAVIANGKIDGVDGKPKFNGVINAGNSGQVLRFVGALAALGEKPVMITGDDSLQKQRPVSPLIEALQVLGAEAKEDKGLFVKGPVMGGKTTLSGEDSQPVSAILMMAPFLSGRTELEVRKSGEKAWIDLTLYWLKKLGVKCGHEEYKRYWVEGDKTIDAFDYSVPGDWSAAAFPLAAALVTGSKLTVDKLDMDDAQGDKAIVDVLRLMGAEIVVKGTSITIKPVAELKGAEIDINPLIDAVTILAVLACFATTSTRIYNGAVARTKECDRLNCITLELKKMGADIVEAEDSLIINPAKLQGAKVKSHGCHRMAMSLAIAAMGADGITEIDGVQWAAKSFPNFKEVMQAVGANIE